MSQNSRTKNVLLNINIGFLTQFGSLMLAFIGRRIFVQYLSQDYLGINGLYTNILSILSLAELGIGNVVQFYLYKPVLENNYDLIRSLLQFFRKVYYAIALVIFIIGMSLVPILKFIVSSNLSYEELVIYYILFLLNSIATYFTAHKTALLIANQENRIQQLVSFVTNILLQILHIAVLVLWHSYIYYVFATLISTIIDKVITTTLCNQRYPYLKEKGKTINFDKKIIRENVTSTFLYKISTTIINNTDNILISILVNTTAVGLYSNYCMIVSGVTSILSIVTLSFISSIGNLSAEGNKKRMLEVFDILLLFYHFIATFCSICFFFLFNDFICIWLGKEFLFDTGTVFTIVFNFYISYAVSPIWMFREANGMFKEVKYLLAFTALANIILSLKLGYIWGTMGILLATSIAKGMTIIWYEPQILFRYVFQKSIWHYWFRQTKYLIFSGIGVFLCEKIATSFPGNFAFILLKSFLFLLVNACLFTAGTWTTKENREVRQLLCHKICHKRRMGPLS